MGGHAMILHRLVDVIAALAVVGLFLIMLLAIGMVGVAMSGLIWGLFH